MFKKNKRRLHTCHLKKCLQPGSRLLIANFVLDCLIVSSRRSWLLDLQGVQRAKIRNSKVSKVVS